MKCNRRFAFLIFLCTQCVTVQAQLLWQYTDSIDEVRRGDHIFTASSGMYVLCDKPTGIQFAGVTPKTHVLYLNKTGVLQWKKTIVLGSLDFSEYGIIDLPILTSLNYLVYKKVKVWNDFWGTHVLEKFEPDGAQTEVEEEFGGNLEPDTQGNFYCLNRTDDGYLLKRFNNVLESTDLWTSATYGGKIKTLGNDEFYQYGSLSPHSNETVFGARKLTSDGTLLWETFYPSSPPSLLQGGTLHASTIDVNENIYLIIRFFLQNGSSDYILTKINALGELLWRHPISVSEFSYANTKIMGDAAGNCYIVGTAGVSSVGYYGYINKYSPDGILVWSRRVTYSNLSSASSIFSDAQLKDEHIFITGSYNWHPTQNPQLSSASDMLVMSVNTETGQIDWKSTFLNTPEGTGIGYGGISLDVKNDTVFVSGSKSVPAIELLVACFGTATSTNGDLINLTPYLTVKTNDPLLAAGKSLDIFPNPAIDQIFLKTPDDYTAGSLRVFNSHGQQVLQKENVRNNQEIKITDLPAGFYSLLWQTAVSVWRGKVVKQ